MNIRLEIDEDKKSSFKDMDFLLVLANHQSFFDILVITAYALEYKRLNILKWMAKDSLKYIPLFGQGMMVLDSIFLKRDWNKDEKKIQETFKRFHKSKAPLWLISFPEGTRATLKKVKKSNDFQYQQNFPLSNYTLQPRTRGLHAILTGLNGHLTHVLDCSISYTRPFPSVWDFAKGNIKSVRLYIRSYPMEEIPSNYTEVKSWINRRYQEKDEYLQTVFEEQEQVQVVEAVS